MANPQLSAWFFYCLVLLLALSCKTSRASLEMKSAVYLSPEILLNPGSVSNKFYYDVDFPRGHIGIKSFNAELVDESGAPVPLHDTYLHHWLMVRYYNPISLEDNKDNNLIIRNSGACQNGYLDQYFGLGSETRNTSTRVPDPYAVEVGNVAEVPEGYEERWQLNVHAIDTRGVVDRLGCTECRCDLYNVTPSSSDYHGGLKCCHDQTQCMVKEGFKGLTKRLFLRYTVKWVDWSESVLPVRIYLFDVTDAWTIDQEASESIQTHNCKVEHDINLCESANSSECIDTKRRSFIMPRGGYVIYSVGHQHAGGTGSALYRKDGRVICSSMPLYGKGKEAGNEAGYIVGMSTCYPRPGSVKMLDGETLVVESNYSNSQKHTGVMGHFYILVADQLPTQNSYLKALIHVHDDKQMAISVWALWVTVLVIFAIAVGCCQKMKNPPAKEGYIPILIEGYSPIEGYTPILIGVGV